MKNFIKYIILFSILFSTEIAVAQLFVASNANISISPDASFCIKGNANNNGSIQNTGTIFLNGDWENTGNYNPTGTMVLNGKNQQINHNAAFYNLTIDSGGNKTFLSNTSITNMLQLENGFVIPNANTHFIIDYLGRTSAGSDISYVNGTLYNSGIGNKYFPIGNSQGFYPAELLSVSGISPIIGFSVKQNTTVVMGSDLSRITSVMNTHYWQKEILSGTYEGGYLALPIMTDDYLYDSLLVEVMQATLLESNFIDIGNNISAESMIPFNYAISTEPALFEYFTLGTTRFVDWKTFYIPNALSKNAPSTEDQAVKIYGDVFLNENFSIRITNNWGNTVFETNSLDLMKTKGWDGTNIKSGKRETTGQYNFIINATAKDGSEYNDAGSIWIID